MYIAEDPSLLFLPNINQSIIREYPSPIRATFPLRETLSFENHSELHFQPVPLFHHEQKKISYAWQKP